FHVTGVQTCALPISMALNDKFDIYGKAGFYSLEWEMEQVCFFGQCVGGSTDDSGLGFEFGTRGMVMPQLEVFADFKFIMLDDNRSEERRVGTRWRAR